MYNLGDSDLFSDVLNLRRSVRTSLLLIPPDFMMENPGYDLDGKKVERPKKLGRGPRARTCYICGREYMLHSFKIHEPQCIKLWEDREKLKPMKERKPVPINPLKQMVREKDKLGETVNLDSREALDELNKASSEAYSGALEACQHCNRTFAGGALAKHQKSCTRANPWKKLGGSGIPTPANKTVVYVKKPVPHFNVRIEKSVTVQFSAPPKKVEAPAWKKKSSDFRAAIRRARTVSKAEERLKESGGVGTIDDYLPPDFHEQAALDYARATADYVECPTCSRTFNPEVAKRHVPACARTTARATRLLRGGGGAHHLRCIPPKNAAHVHG